MAKEHVYSLTITWTGNTGTGTSNYRTYERSHSISATGKPEILASSDPAFRGDKNRYNPEELLLASLSGCHMLWFLHLCADQGIVVTGYVDHPSGVMAETADGGGRFTAVTLHPVVTMSTPDSLHLLHALHERAHQLCFIANSVNFPVTHVPQAKII